jgi:phosphopantetheinyl transferase (holo-ACP synthase)
MAFIKNWECTSGAKLYLWDIQTGSSQIYAENGTKHSARDLEKLAIKEIIGLLHPNTDLQKDNFGKPYFIENTTQINYSHAKNIVFWGEHEQFKIGVDVEHLRPQLATIKHKFCREDEFAFIPSENELPYLLAIWSAKEAIYKSYGRKEVDFQKHMQILPFEIGAEGVISANFLLGQTTPMQVHYTFDGTMIACWTIFPV